MKNIKILFFLVILFFLQSLLSVEKYVVGARGAGFFSEFFSVLMHLIGCEKKNLVPVVYWDRRTPYYVDNGKQYNNVWEYYFEPVSNLKLEKDDKIHRDYNFSDAPYIHWIMPNYVSNFNYNFRKYMNEIIKKYIKIKKHILNKIELFFNNHMEGKKIIGVHVRQSVDKLLDRIPLIDVNIFLKIVDKYDGYHIFVASDNYAIIEKFRKRFPGRVIFYNAHRSSDFSAHYLGRDKKDPLNAIIGEEVLIEAILLSRCNLFIHSVSNVATGVLFFNPELEHIFLDSKQVK